MYSIQFPCERIIVIEILYSQQYSELETNIRAMLNRSKWATANKKSLKNIYVSNIQQTETENGSKWMDEFRIEPRDKHRIKNKAK